MLRIALNYSWATEVDTNVCSHPVHLWVRVECNYYSYSLTFCDSRVITPIPHGRMFFISIRILLLWCIFGSPHSCLVVIANISCICNLNVYQGYVVDWTPVVVWPIKFLKWHIFYFKVPTIKDVPWKSLISLIPNWLPLLSTKLQEVLTFTKKYFRH